MADPIERLLREHREIMRQVAELRGALRALAERREDALEETRLVFLGTARMIETELLAHARREDEALFPAVARALEDGSLTDQMKLEHRDIHAEADRFRGTLRELHQVEHPAIVAGGARLGQLASAGSSVEILRTSGAELIRLLDEHFRKEEEILFPMAREALTSTELDEVARAMDAL